MRNEQKWCLDAFRGNANGAKHTRNVSSHILTPNNVSGENMTRREKVKKKRLKTAKIEGYNTRVRAFPGLDLRTPRDAS